VKGPLKEITPEQKADLALITKHPSWPLLRDRWFEVLEHERYDLGKTLLVPQSEVDLSYIKRRQGFWQGVKAVLDTPDAAMSMIRAEEESEVVTSE
jgi:hypothetical protein